MRFVFTEHPPKPGANLINVQADSLEAAVAKVRQDLMWLQRVGMDLYETVDQKVYQVKAAEDDIAEHDGARD